MRSKRGTIQVVVAKMINRGAEGGSRTRMSFRTTDFKSRDQRCYLILRNDMSQYLRAWRSSSHRFGWLRIDTVRHHLSPIFCRTNPRFSVLSMKVFLRLITTTKRICRTVSTMQSKKQSKSAITMATSSHRPWASSRRISVNS